MANNRQLRRVTSRLLAGFTLVEVMVALAIVGVALPALVTLVMSQLDGAGHIRSKTYAMWVAENQLTRLNLLNNKVYFPNYKLSEKDSGKTEMMGFQWQWQYEAKKNDDIPMLLEVEIGVVPLGLAESGGFKGTSGMTKSNDPLATITGFMSE